MLFILIAVLFLLLFMGIPLRHALKLGLIGAAGLLMAFKLLRASIWLALVITLGVMIYGYLLARRQRESDAGRRDGRA